MWTVGIGAGHAGTRAVIMRRRLIGMGLTNPTFRTRAGYNASVRRARERHLCHRAREGVRLEYDRGTVKLGSVAFALIGVCHLIWPRSVSGFVAALHRALYGHSRAMPESGIIRMVGLMWIAAAWAMAL